MDAILKKEKERIIQREIFKKNINCLAALFVVKINGFLQILKMHFMISAQIKIFMN